MRSSTIHRRPWSSTAAPAGLPRGRTPGIGRQPLTKSVRSPVGRPKRFDGLFGLSVSIPVAALITATVGVPQAWGHLTLEVLLIALVAAILLPLIPWTLELLALRRLTKAAFGTLMALEPAFAVIIGVVLLSQAAGVLDIVGICCVMAAGIAAERTGHRGVDQPDLESPIT